MESKSQEWIEQTEMKIREAFELFDKEKADAIMQEEVSLFLLASSIPHVLMFMIL